MLHRQDPRRQRLGCVVVVNRNGPLDDDRTGVEFRRHEVHGRAADLRAVLKCLALWHLTPGTPAAARDGC